MPILGADMREGTLVAWRKQPGDRLERGDIIAEVETDKADVEVEVFVSGVLEEILVEPGAKVAVGTPLAVIREERRAKAAPVAPGAERPRLRASPSARRMAGELGIELATVVGSGPNGRVMRRDVERAASARGVAVRAPAPAQEPAPEPAPEPAAVTEEEARIAERQGRMRQAIAAAMERSAREIPQYRLSAAIDMSWVIDWLAVENERRPLRDRLLPAVLLIKATALALREAPELNATWADGRAHLKDDIHVGVAVFLRRGGLVAPALHHTDRKSLDELMAGFQDLVRRARAGSLRSSELTDPTITVTSLGDQGVDEVHGLVYPPQSAIVGFGRISERPWAVKGGVVARPLCTVTLSADHRITDGRIGSRFLNAIDRLLQRPERL